VVKLILNTSHKLPFQKNLSNIGPEHWTGPLNNFRGLKTMSSKTTVKSASKNIKKLFKKIYFYRSHRRIIFFQLFSTGFASCYRGAPLSPFEFLIFWQMEIKADTRKNNPQKIELRYLKKWIFYVFYKFQYRRHCLLGINVLSLFDASNVSIGGLYIMHTVSCGFFVLWSEFQCAHETA
jgi:hypothetical protein